jgi:hypothetical protein
MATQPKTFTTEIESDYGMDRATKNIEDASKNIIEMINSAAKMKQEEVKFQRAMVLEAVRHKYDLKNKQAEKNTMSPLEQQQYDTQAKLGKQFEAQDPSMPSSAPITGFPSQPEQNPNAVMSLIGGGMGDINAQPVQEMPQPSPQPTPVNEASLPTLKLTNQGIFPRSKQEVMDQIEFDIADGKPVSQKSLDFLKEHKDLKSASLIGQIDINQIPRPQNEDERVQVLGMLPPDVAENVQAAGEYRLDATKVYGLRNNSGDRAKFDALINRIYPQWDMKKYVQRQKYLNSLADTSSAKLGGQILALNTLPKHLETFLETIEALKNAGLKPKNAIINYAKNVLGYPEITDFKMAKEIVCGEMQKVVTGAAVTQEGMRRVDAMLSENAGYDQMISNAKIMIKIAEGRLEPMQTQYKNVMGKDESGDIIYPESRAIFDKYKSGSKPQIKEDQFLYNGQYYDIKEDETGRQYIDAE